MFEFGQMSHCKGQTKLKCFFQANISFKKWTKKFDFTIMIPQLGMFFVHFFIRNILTFSIFNKINNFEVWYEILTFYELKNHFQILGPKFLTISVLSCMGVMEASKPQNSWKPMPKLGEIILSSSLKTKLKIETLQPLLLHCKRAWRNSQCSGNFFSPAHVLTPCIINFEHVGIIYHCAPN